jgi:predicted acylesterase/phospholipase RssA
MAAGSCSSSSTSSDTTTKDDSLRNGCRRTTAAGCVSWALKGERVAGAYRRHLFGNATLQDLPTSPRFTFCATNLGSGALVRFERRRIADWRVGRIARPDVELAVAVACSSAFPPVLSPYRLRLGDADWQTDASNELATAEHRDELVLTDGGVYDNLGSRPPGSAAARLSSRTRVDRCRLTPTRTPTGRARPCASCR